MVIYYSSAFFVMNCVIFTGHYGIFFCHLLKLEQLRNAEDDSKAFEHIHTYYADKMQTEIIFYPVLPLAVIVSAPLETNFQDINNKTFILCPFYYVTHPLCLEVT